MPSNGFHPIDAPKLRASGAVLDLKFNPLARPGSHWSATRADIFFALGRRPSI
jgi:hypothetical protein